MRKPRMRKFTKLFTNKIKSLDEDTRQAEFVISTDQVDRAGEVVAQEWELDNYKQNPIVLFGHDPSTAENVIGKCLEISTDESEDVKKTTAKVQFAEEGTSNTADTVWKLVKQGILRTVSVGFIPHACENEDKSDMPTILKNNELLEFSIVPIPCNPNAIALAYDDGSITEKDAKFMVKTYEKEADLLKHSMCDTIKATTDSSNLEKEKEMSEEEMAKLAEVVGTAVSEAIAPKLEEILNAVKGNEEEKPAEEQPEEPAEEMGGEEGKSQVKAEQDDEAGAYDENEELDEEAEKSFLAELEKDYKELN